MAQHLTAPVPSTKMPKGIPYIIGNEAAERFSFYGMKAVLTIFMVNYLHLMGGQAEEAMPEPKAVAYYHLFTTAVYFTPFFGALIADAFFGKYRTIMTLSIVYCVGHACLAGMGVAGPAKWWLLAGLGLISIGSGGIKPCVSAHVGDQFGKSNSHLVTRIFFWFYFSINLGSAISTVMTPWLLQWYGPHVAFGVPGVLMGLATIVFWMGRHVFVHIPAQGESFIKELTSSAGLSAIGKLFIIYLFVAVFWALFDQTGSSWVLQARDMDRYIDILIWKGELLPSQIQVFNPVFVMVLIAFFGLVVYPLVNKVTNVTPIRKIGAGLFVMVIGFGIVAWTQERIDAGETPSLWWQILAYVILTGAEVMVSITALEFSYTQSPRRLKSVVMAVYLASVSLGNLFTAGVNAAILVPSSTESASTVASRANAWLLDNLDRVDGDGGQLLPTADDLKIPKKARFVSTETGFDVVTAGHDGAFDTADDVRAVFELNDDGFAFTRSSVETQGLDEVRAAMDRIVDAWNEDGSLPTTQRGQELIGDVEDPWGNGVVYTLQNRYQFRVLSLGPDGERDTEWDLGFVVEEPIPKKEKTTDKLTWLEKRKAELGVSDDAEDRVDDEATEATEATEDEEPDDGRSRTEFVGGQVTLEGASYFWFFTWVMLGAALLFIPVGLLYKPRTYLQEEAPAEGAD